MIDNCFVEHEPLLTGMVRRIQRLNPASENYTADLALAVKNYAQMLEVFNHRWYETERAQRDTTHPWHNYVKFGKAMSIGDVMMDFESAGYNVGFRATYEEKKPSPVEILTVKRPDEMHKILGYYGRGSQTVERVA